MSVLLPLKNCKQMFWGHVKKLQSVDKLLIHWWFLLDNQHQKSAGKNSNIHSILTTYNTHGYTMRHGEVKMVTVQRCGQQYIHMHWRQCTQIMPGGGGGVGGWVADYPLRCFIQMHTVGRMVVLYTMLGIVGYLLSWKYSCFISSTENNPIKWELGSMAKRLECWTYSSLVQHM